MFSRAHIGIGLVVATLSACGQDPEGGEGEACFANGACYSGLTCLATVCVDAGTCTPGMAQACACPTGIFGVQHCDDLGEWEDCSCGAACGDGTCNTEESAATCPADCPAQPCGTTFCDADAICFDGLCLEEWPACFTEGGPDDRDLEPNGTLAQAVTLPCGEDPRTDPTYADRCPSRSNYTNGLMNLLVCPGGDTDYYRIYLQEFEQLAVQLTFMHTTDPPGNLDLRAWRWHAATEEYVLVATGQSTNNNESIAIETSSAQGNPEGWYYLEVYGATASDVNQYTVSTTLNPEW